MSRKALIIFAKNPQLGKVKTRLAATVGDEKALHIYNVLLNHTKESTCELPQDKFIFYSQHVEQGDLWDDDNYHKHVQTSGDLGEKMLAAFQHCFDDGYDSVCIIGSDMMEINETIIAESFTLLDDTDVVIGPAKDGGYYLLGMNKLFTQPFNNKNWSTETVLLDTIKDIESDQLSYSLLRELNDIDTEDDWEQYLATTIK